MQVVGYSVLFLLSMSISDAHARLIENWPYEKLFKEADVVVIAEATATADTGEKIMVKDWQTEFLEVNTTFAVKHVLKGDAALKSLSVRHLRAPDGALIRNGPLFVVFRTDGISFETKQLKGKTGKPEYMLFLKSRKDGRFEAVSGQIDPILSVKQLYHDDLAQTVERLGRE